MQRDKLARECGLRLLNNMFKAKRAERTASALYLWAGTNVKTGGGVSDGPSQVSTYTNEPRNATIMCMPFVFYYQCIPCMPDSLRLASLRHPTSVTNDASAASRVLFSLASVLFRTTSTTSRCRWRASSAVCSCVFRPPGDLLRLS